MNTKKIYTVIVTIFTFCYICNAQSYSDYKLSTLEFVAKGESYTTNTEDLSNAQNELAIRYYNGSKGATKDIRKAAYWFLQSAKNGNKYAQYNIAQRYKKGDGVKINLKAALYWFRKSGEQHFHKASLQAGKMYFYGKGSDVNYENAAKCFKDAAFGDIPEGKFYYALCYAKGYGVPRDSVKTWIWANRAINDKYYRIYWVLGKMYEEGETVTKDYSYARFYYEKGVEHGIAACANSLGLGYENGTLADYSEKDTNKALEYFQIAAEKGNRLGKANLARLYANKDLDVYNPQKAELLYKELVQSGYEQYDNNLFRIYRETNNKQGIFEINKKWADKGNTLAMNRLAYMYVKGEGTAPSLEKALSIINEALEKEPDNLNYLDTKGDVYLIWGEEKKAKSIWKKIKKINPNFYDKPTDGFSPSDLNAYFVAKSK